MLQTVWFWDPLRRSGLLSCLLKVSCTSELGGGVSHERAELYNALRASTPIPPHVLSDFASATRPPPCSPLLLFSDEILTSAFYPSFELIPLRAGFEDFIPQTFLFVLWNIWTRMEEMRRTVKTLTTMYNNAIFWPDPSVYYTEPLAKTHDTGCCSLRRAHMPKILKFTTLVSKSVRGWFFSDEYHKIT